MLLRSCPHLYLPAFPGSARGRCYYKPSHLPPSPLIQASALHSTVRAALMRSFPAFSHSTASKASLPMTPSMCGSALQRQLSQGCREQIYARGRGFGSGAASLGFGSHTGVYSHLPPNLSASQWPPSAMRCCISLGTQVAFHHAAQYVCAPGQV